MNYFSILWLLYLELVSFSSPGNPELNREGYNNYQQGNQIYFYIPCYHPMRRGVNTPWKREECIMETSWITLHHGILDITEYITAFNHIMESRLHRIIRILMHLSLDLCMMIRSVQRTR